MANKPVCLALEVMKIAKFQQDFGHSPYHQIPSNISGNPQNQRAQNLPVPTIRGARGINVHQYFLKVRSVGLHLVLKLSSPWEESRCARWRVLK